MPTPPATVVDVGGGSGAIAIPLAQAGYEVTVVDPSPGMLAVAERRAAEAGVSIETMEAGVAAVRDVASGPFDVVCCHAVLLYLEDPAAALTTLRAVARPGSVLSLLEKNRDALAMRPGVLGDFAEALRVLDDPVATGNLGIPNRSYPIAAWRDWLAEAGWRVDAWAGVRLFSDTATDDLEPDRFQTLLELERRAGRCEPYRSLSRLVHI